MLPGNMPIEELKQQYKGEQYVIVNTTRGAAFDFYPWQKLVMPGEEPHTYGFLDEAIEGWLWLEQEYEHDLSTAQIYRLVPVPVEEIEERLVELRPEFEEEFNEDW